jgi:transposase InsO family protein
VIFSFIETERADHSVPLMCRILRVSRSGYYAWRERPPSCRERGNAVLGERIRRIHRDSRGTYGAPRIHAQLRAEGVRVGNKRVAMLMRHEGLEGCHRPGSRGAEVRPRGERPPLGGGHLVCAHVGGI